MHCGYCQHDLEPITTTGDLEKRNGRPKVTLKYLIYNKAADCKAEHFIFRQLHLHTLSKSHLAVDYLRLGNTNEKVGNEQFAHRAPPSYKKQVKFVPSISKWWSSSIRPSDCRSITMTFNPKWFKSSSEKRIYTQKVKTICHMLNTTKSEKIEIKGDKYWHRSRQIKHAPFKDLHSHYSVNSMIL